MHRYLVTGTDTDVGKTRVTAALAKSLKYRSLEPTIVKLVQTGLKSGDESDAARAGRLAGCRSLELARFDKGSDPWSAAVAMGAPSVQAEDLQQILSSMTGAVVCEGAGGLAVPLNRRQNFGTIARLANLRIVLAIGLRLGCMNHALLTMVLCDLLQLQVAGAVLVERFGPTEKSYQDDIARTLQGKLDILGILRFESDEARSVEEGARLFSTLT
ncbi:MAG: dethiobiotin synthase [Candidatus Eremiobacteraeota bacterium]|nr:dethiobiotin synthase [Candidatus Eremiobacteraeota bacterium]